MTTSVSHTPAATSSADNRPPTAWEVLELAYSRSGGYIADALPLLAAMAYEKAPAVHSMLTSSLQRNPKATRFWIHRGSRVRVA